jgi:hypothetical protein
MTGDLDNARYDQREKEEEYVSQERKDGMDEKGRKGTNPTIVRSSDCFERAEFLH